MARRIGIGSVASIGLMVMAVVPYLVLALQTPPEPVKPVDFVEEIMPVVKAKCLSCHGGTETYGGLDLRTPEAWMKGGDSGPLFIPGKPDESLLIERLTTKDRTLLMPQGMAPLRAPQVKLFRDWIAQGAAFQIRTFERDIKPLFVRKCSTCHQGDSPAAGLDLHALESVLEVIEPGDPESSTLVRRIKGYDGLERMPKGFKALEDAEIQMVEDWIAQGATKGKPPEIHWAYRAVAKPAVPDLSSEWVKNPIDAFVLARLRSEGLEPSAPASREKLLRRMTQDLTGLPPTLEELDQFVAGGETTEQAIDRLLSSPRYGERMAVPWLDLARYADTNGYEKDGTRSIWKYRDWVIHAFNSNMPYNEFTVKQLAGDLLPNPTLADLVATGFNRNTMLNLEGGVDQEEAMYQVRYDRADTTSTVWLGQTMACARCHDHKYDPISHKEYFQFYAFFANNRFYKVGDASISEQKYIEPTMQVPSPEQAKALEQMRSRVTSAEAALASVRGDLVVERAEWERLAVSPDLWQDVRVSTQDARLVVAGSEVSAPGPGPDTMSYELSLDLPKGTTAIRVRVLPEKGRPYDGPGRADSGNFILSRVTADRAKVRFVAADFTQGGYSTAGILDSDPETGWAISGAAGRPHELVIEFDKPVSGKLELGLHCESTRWVRHTLGKFTISATSAAGATRFAVPDAVRRVLEKPMRSDADVALLARHYESVALVGREEREALRMAKAELGALEATIPTTLVMVEENGKTEAPIRHRGEFMSPTEVVSSGTPTAFGGAAAGSRLDLARWIVDPANPLTARVQVNRLWEMVFGRGLVETSENFGTQGTPPSHPELLDWLAATYMESGWDTKAMLKLIMSSATYKQSSGVTKERLEKDPANVLLSRGPRFRLTAEFIRDQALAASGLLHEQVGGPPVFPYQPDGVWDSPYSGERWMPSTGADALRRSLYTFWKRTAPYPSFMAFDAGSREQCTVRRSRTNTPLQALATLNDPGLFSAAESMGERFARVSGSTETRLAVAFRTVTSRVPSAAELERLTDYFEQTRATKGEKTAWTMVANVLLNLDEALTKE